jgi:hypothetical protein
MSDSLQFPLVPFNWASSLPFNAADAAYDVASRQDGSYKEAILTGRFDAVKPKPAPSTAFGRMNASDVRRIAISCANPATISCGLSHIPGQ